MNPETECGECKHPYYDHVGWRRGAPGVACRIVRCGCEAFRVGNAGERDHTLFVERDYEREFGTVSGSPQYDRTPWDRS